MLPGENARLLQEAKKPMTVQLAGLIVLVGLTAPAGDKKPTSRELLDESRSIVVVSDRDEKFVNFFHRQRIVIGGSTVKDLKAQLKAKEPGKAFISYATYNHGRDGKPGKGYSTFGAHVRIAPISAPVAKALEAALKEKDDSRIQIVFRRDVAKLPSGKDEPQVWHVVGYCKKKVDVRYFERKEAKGLLHVEKK
jgi:hypothetical protein